MGPHIPVCDAAAAQGPDSEHLTHVQSVMCVRHSAKEINMTSCVHCCCFFITSASLALLSLTQT